MSVSFSQWLQELVEQSGADRATCDRLSDGSFLVVYSVENPSKIAKTVCDYLRDERCHEKVIFLWQGQRRCNGSIMVSIYADHQERDCLTAVISMLDEIKDYLTVATVG